MESIQIKRACGHFCSPLYLSHDCKECNPDVKDIETGSEPLDHAISIVTRLKKYTRNLNAEIEIRPQKPIVVEVEGEEETKEEPKESDEPPSIILRLTCKKKKRVSIELKDDDIMTLTDTLKRFSDTDLSTLADAKKSISLFLMSPEYRSKYWDSIEGLKVNSLLIAITKLTKILTPIGAVCGLILAVAV